MGNLMQMSGASVKIMTRLNDGCQPCHCVRKKKKFRNTVDHFSSSTIMGKSKSKSHKANASKLRNRALNAFDLAGDDVDNRAERRLGRATLDNQAKANGSDDEEEVDYLSGEVKSEDDEEIDSDTAFPSDDDFDLDEFMGGASTKKKSSKKKPKVLTLNESEDDESESEQSEASVDEGEFVSLSEAWDMDTKDDQNTVDSKPEESDALTLVSDISESEDAESEEEDSLADSESDGNDSDGDDDELDFSDISDDGMDEDQLNKLRAQISDLSKKAGKEEAKKVRKLEVNNLTEGEFSIPSSNKLTLADLTAGAKGTANSSIKLMKSLTKNDSGGSGKKSAESLSIPLPRRIQDRYDRAAAFEVAKEEVDKWKDTVQANRQADHLVFPMNKETPLTKQTASAPIQPTTDLERKVDGLLKESSLSSEKTLTNFEELAPSKLSMEEVKRRRNELRMMRELLFREEQKAKRIKKIKSKSYRRVHKKERERLKSMVDGSDGELDKEGLDMERARERMSLKHKNTGKWAKRMVEQGFTKDKETRSEMEEMLRRGETLRKKIMGESRDSDSEISDNAAEYSDEEEATEIKGKLEKGIMGMNFIKEHQAKQRASNQRNMELMEKAEEEDGWEELAERDDEANEFINEGRMKFAPGSKQSKSEIKQLVEEAKQNAAEESTLASRLQSQHKSKVSGSSKKSKDVVGKETIEYRENGKARKLSQISKAEDESSDESSEENPWLTVSDGPKKRSSKTGVIAHGNNTTSEKQILRAKKQRAANGNDKQDQALIDMNQTLSVVDPYGSDIEEGAQSESENMIVAPKNKKLSFKQKDLVKRAFAGDDVVTEFQEEKRARIEDEGDKEVDITLPGWGSWGGDGLAPAKKVIKKISGVKAENRKDAKLKNVIINEKVNKKNAKYNSNSVPFPFESREQYERSLRTPVGQEWTSKSTFQKLTKPRVLVKKGVVIDPLKAPFK